MNKSLQVAKYVLADFFAAVIAWALFFAYRKISYSPDIDILQNILSDKNFLYGIVFLPLGWVIFYWLIGSYKRIYHKSRLKEIGQTFGATFIGVTLIFFVLILDDLVINNYQLFWFLVVLFGLHFSLTAIFRFILTSITAYKIHNRIIGFNTLVIGGNGKATEMFLEI